MDHSEILSRFEALQFPLEVDMGSCEMSIRDALELKPGSVFATDQPAGAPLLLRAGGAPVATVEVVLIEDAVSVRVKNIHQNAAPADGSSAASPQA